MPGLQILNLKRNSHADLSEGEDEIWIQYGFLGGTDINKT